ALAFFFYVLAVILGTSPLAALTGQIAWSNLPGYLAFANLLLGLFNLIPAFPMDGGRVLRAILALRMPYPRATSVAVVVGQGLAIAIGLWGFVDGNLLMILIAVFIWIGAGQEGEMVQAKDLLRAMQVGQAMTRHPKIVSMVLAADPLSRAVDLTLSTAQSDFPVLSAENGPVVGLLTREDVIRGLRSHGATVTIDEVMHPDVPVVVAEAPLFQAQQQMVAAGLRALPVVDQWGALVGLLTLTDIGEAYAFQSLTDNSSRAVV
ncbi:MAG: CBS domain-containing protein, partial [Chloroflexi bacterium]|nr:CBS domain-containing protein [Chloroflexota bacterium]